MEIFTPNYSMKNIPYPSKNQFFLSLTDEIIDFIKMIRWETFFFLNPRLIHDEENNPILLKSLNTPPSNKMLDSFEG